MSHHDDPDRASRTSSPPITNECHGEAALRRKVTVLENALNRLEADGPGREYKKRKISATAPGRGIRKVVDLYHDLSDLVAQADRHAAIDLLDHEELAELDKIDFIGLTDEEIEEERKDRKRCHIAVKLLNKLIPGFENKLGDEDVDSYLSPLQTGANDARSDDTGKLKSAVVDWLNNRTPEPTPALAARNKEQRGIGNDTTGRLLCPIDYDWEDPEVRAKLRNANPGFDIASSFFLCCLYEDETGDLESPEAGFLKGPLLVRAYRHIFTSPSSAADENLNKASKSRRRDVASKVGLNSHVTPRSIAYAATQLLFSLNTASDWVHQHAGFHYPSFYNFIVDFFEEAQDTSSKKSVDDLLQWWNHKIFPVSPSSTNLNAGSLPRCAMVSSQKRLKEARARQAHHQTAEPPQ